VGRSSDTAQELTEGVWVRPLLQQVHHDLILPAGSRQVLHKTADESSNQHRNGLSCPICAKSDLFISPLENREATEDRQILPLFEPPHTSIFRRVRAPLKSRQYPGGIQDALGVSKAKRLCNEGVERMMPAVSINLTSNQCVCPLQQSASRRSFLRGGQRVKALL
jgi:hypothetical protein